MGEKYKLRTNVLVTGAVQTVSLFAQTKNVPLNVFGSLTLSNNSLGLLINGLVMVIFGFDKSAGT